ncbi:MAG: hypothetical protein IJU16_04340 [Clostridia bacterium]|nr:hypothetical protein [Clostridia bacterium]
MKQCKCVLCVLICLLLCLSGMAVSAEGDAKVMISTASAKPGETVSIDLSIQCDQTFGALGFYLTYDAQALECVSAEEKGVLAKMGMSTVNTSPNGQTGEIWVTGMSLSDMQGDGPIATLTFRVKEDAATGWSQIAFSEREQEWYQASGNSTVAIPFSMTNGGINITTDGGQDTPTAVTTAEPNSDPEETQAPATVSSQSNATTPTSAPVTQADGSIAVTNAAGQAVTMPDGSAATLAPVATLLGASGTAATQANGDVLEAAGVGVLVEGGTVQPGGKATVKLSLTEVPDLASFQVRLAYDATHLNYLSGKLVGFVADMPNAAIVTGTETVGNDILITAMNTSGVSGSGVIAELEFQVYSDTPAGTYAVTFAKGSELYTTEMGLYTATEIPGAIQVEGAIIPGFERVAENGGGMLWLWLLIGGLAIVGVIVGVIMAARKKNAAPVGAPTQAAVERSARPVDLDAEAMGTDEESTKEISETADPTDE